MDGARSVVSCTANAPCSRDKPPLDAMVWLSILLRTGDRFNGRDLAVGKSCKEVMGKNKWVRAVLDIPKYFAILSWNEESNSGCVNASTAGSVATNSVGKKIAHLVLGELFR